MSNRHNNFLFILSDQHNKEFSGRRNPVFHTPNLDGLAERGTEFDRAYTNCPICVPARASMATGRYVHEIGNWDNAHPYHGENESWHHVLRKKGVDVSVIGKLHFRSREDDNGFSEEIDTLHVFEGGDLQGCIRDQRAGVRHKRGEILSAGSGNSSYLEYDARIAEQAVDWLRARVEQQGEKPWLLWVSFVCPHPPYLAPEKWFNFYAERDLPEPPQQNPKEWNPHPALQLLRYHQDQEQPFSAGEIARMNRAYAASISNLDENIGKVLSAFDELGLRESTNVIYTTDHGESRGSRGLFGKFTMYEESCALPFIAVGPDYPTGRKTDIPISLVDLFPTFLNNFGIERDDEDGRPGSALLDLLDKPPEKRHVFSEYHALHFHHAVYMICDHRFKYIHYHNSQPEMYDLETDPAENHNLWKNPDFEALGRQMREVLYSIVDPAEVDLRAKVDQARKIEEHGGVEVIKERGHFHNSPTPGEEARFVKN